MKYSRGFTVRCTADHPAYPRDDPLVSIRRLAFSLAVQEMDEGTRTCTFVSNRSEARMPTSFKVIIVGGSVSGLTLAHCLDRLGIDFEILERNDQIAPQLGASVGILPNGARILDQLGLFVDIEQHIEPLEFARIRYADGFRFESQYPKALHER